ncbi:aromatic acid exporter family protein [Streptomyces sp. NPDC088745]|uniref:FUSC family protein n=1 Tax=Streptomyces sp. NPDC088745 TaxID=3365884 RepID=UPI00382927EB
MHDEEPAGRVGGRRGTTNTAKEKETGSGGEGVLPRALRWLRRAFHHSGHERHTLLLAAKSVVAATLAWFIAYDVMGARSPAFAPFSAVLVMQTTVYQSVVQSLRYVGAVVVGVAVQAALGFIAGPDLLTFVLVAIIALAIARWPVLGSQGSQVPTAAFFAFSTYVAAADSADRIGQLAQIVALVAIGCVVGTLVHIVLVPPLRHRSAEDSIHTLAHTLRALLSDMVPELREGAPQQESAAQWRRRAARTDRLIDEARAGLRTAQESVHLNPRGRLRGHRRHVSFDGYSAVLEALVRTLYQVASLTRSLDQWYGDSEGSVVEGDDRPFLRRYADFLDALAALTDVLGELDEDRLPEQAEQLCGLAEKAQECRRALSEEASRQGLPLADPAHPYGVLVVEATRLMEECQNCCDVLQGWAREE